MGELALLIPLAPFLIGGFAIWTRHQQKIAEMQIKHTAEKAAQYAATNTELEDRVRVLERIVTDKGYDVAAQIEALRDTRKVDAMLDAPRPCSRLQLLEFPFEVVALVGHDAFQRSHALLQRVHARLVLRVLTRLDLLEAQVVADDARPEDDDDDAQYEKLTVVHR
jgi:hypothetical protein